MNPLEDRTIRRSLEQALTPKADRALHGELCRDHVAERIAGVRSPPIRLVEIPQRVAKGVRPPNNLVQVSDQFPAARVNLQAVLASLVPQQSVDTVDAVSDRWILAWNSV